RRYGKSVTGPGAARLVGYRLENGAGVVTVELAGAETAERERIDVRDSVAGEHMAGNAVAALVARLEMGAPLEGLLDGLAAFGGVRRGLELTGVARGVRV